MSIRDAMLCVLVQFATELRTPGVVLVLVAIAVVFTLTTLLARWVVARLSPGSGTRAPSWVGATLIAIVVYVGCRLVDPLLAGQNAPPAGFTPELWARVGFFEWKLFGTPGLWAVLPLEDHPAIGLVLHAIFWPIFIVLVRTLLLRIHDADAEIEWDTPEQRLPWYYRWSGSTTARRADDRYRAWSRGLIVVLSLLHLTSAGLFAAGASDADQHRMRASCLDGAPIEAIPSEDVPTAFRGVPLGGDEGTRPGNDSVDAGAPVPAAGAWVLAGFFLLAWTLQLKSEGRPPDDEDDDEDGDGPEELTADSDPLERLTEAVRAISPGAHLEALEQRDADPGDLVEMGEAFGPLVHEVFETMTKGESLYRHQSDVLDHLASSWRVHGTAERGAAPSLAEEAHQSPVTEAEGIPHALVIAPEGAGRTTLSVLAAVHGHLDRGATSLIIVRDRDAARAYAARARQGVLASSARWNIQVVIAGDDLAAAVLAGRTPAIVVAGLEEFESEVLSDQRTDPFFGRLGLIVADDLDAFTGVAEMHLHMAMRRLWALLDTLHDASYPAVLLALAGPSASGMSAWARHVLAAPLKLFEGSTAPRARQLLLRRRDLVDASGRDLPLATLAEACDAAGMRWHLRLAGDTHRGVRRAEIDLGRLRRHHTSEPLDAEVVLIEGTYPDVRREAERLAHAGRRTDDAVVLVLAPPADEEMVLHEEAVDAAHKGLVDALPRAITLSEPDLVRQRHFDRALGREQSVAALRSRFGASFVDDILGRLAKSGRVRFREVYYFDPRTDDAATRRLVRSTSEEALGEPIDARCVGDANARIAVVDRGTSEVLTTVDQAIAPALYPPSRVLLHPRGRYTVLEEMDGALPAENAAEPCRTTADRVVDIELPERLDAAARQLGGKSTRVALARGRVTELFSGVRRYGPGPRLLEHRRYDRPVAASYFTDICLVSGTLVGRDEIPLVLSEAAAFVPLTAALRMALPCYLRGAEELVDVASVEVEGERMLAFFDRTPGASGFTRAIHQHGLADLMRLARLVLERLVGSEFVRLRRIHDLTADGEATPWDTRSALEWLDAALESEPGTVEARGPMGPRIEYTEGEGLPGDLGRLWISSTGRTDDLVWTRHTWHSERGFGSTPAGRVSLDVAVERRAIARAVGRGVEAGVPRSPLQTTEAEAWGAAHRPLLASALEDLAPIVDRLEGLTGERYIESVLALVAAIPTRVRPLSPAERAPLAVLARRKGDASAKALLAMALLPDACGPEVLWSPSRALVRLTKDGERALFDLGGVPQRVRTEDAREVAVAVG